MTPERWERLKGFLTRTPPPGGVRAGSGSTVSISPSLRLELDSLREADGRLGPALERLADWDTAPASGEPTAGLAVIDGLRVVRRIAAGGFGEVYLCEQDRPRRHVAVKVMRGGLGGTPRLLLREAQFLASLSHPGIARVYAAGEFTPPGCTTPLPYFSMEYVENGVPITSFASELGLEARGRVELFLQVCEAVDHAHVKGVVHLDLKPGNMLVGSDGRVKVLDFGVSRLLRTSDCVASESVTAEGLLGTLAYMSPEHARGERERIDARSDVYSLGLVLFELLAGRQAHAFLGIGMLEALRRVCQEDPPRLSRVSPGLGRDLDAIVGKATARDPACRYNTVAGLADDLKRWLAQRPVVARAPSGLDRVEKFVRRHRALVALTVCVLAGLSVALVVTATALTHARAANKALTTTTGALLNDAVRLLTPVVGAHEARRALLTSLHEAARTSMQSNPNDATAAGAYARVVLEFGSLHMEAGDTQAARAMFDEALTVAEQVSTAHPDDPNAGLLASLAMIRRGDVALQEKDFALGEKLYNRARDLHASHAAAHPDDDRWVGELVFDCERLAPLALDCGDANGALALNAEQLYWADRLVRMRGADASSMHALASAHYLLGCRLRNRDAAAALVHAREAFTAAEEGGLWSLTNSVHSRTMILSVIGLGHAQQATGAYLDALNCFSRAIDLAETLVRSDRSDLNNLATQVDAFASRSHQHFLLNNRAAALSDIDHAIALAHSLAELAPEHEGWRAWPIQLAGTREQLSTKNMTSSRARPRS